MIFLVDLLACPPRYNSPVGLLFVMQTMWSPLCFCLSPLGELPTWLRHVSVLCEVFGDPFDLVHLLRCRAAVRLPFRQCMLLRQLSTWGICPNFHPFDSSHRMHWFFIGITFLPMLLHPPFAMSRLIQSAPRFPPRSLGCRGQHFPFLVLYCDLHLPFPI